MKATSSVISTILMLLVTIAIAGTAYMYITGVFTRQTAISFSIINSYQDAIYVSNDGTTIINDFTATLDGQPVQVAIVPNIGGLVGYWRFEEGGGITTYDYSGYRNDGILQNQTNGYVTWGSGYFGKAVYFEGAATDGPMINLPNVRSLNLTQPFTIMARVNPRRIWVSQPIVVRTGAYGNAGLFIDSGQLCLYWGNYSDNSRISICGGNINLYAWQYVAATYDEGGLANIYINGANVGSANKIVTSYADLFANPFRIGYFWNGDTSFNGTIDEVLIYNQALTEQWIKQLHSGLLLPGQTATVRLSTSLSKGFHNFRLCTSNMCRSGHMMIG